MRLLLGALILLALFSAAALWQRTWTSEARSERAPFPGAPGAASTGAGDGWSRVLVGRPSGGEPYATTSEGGSEAASQAIHESDAVAQPNERPTAPQTPPEHPPETAGDAVVDVQAGQTLSEICRVRYGTARPGLVLAVARYNSLAGPDEIREGQQIRLPAAEKLHEEN